MRVANLSEDDRGKKFQGFRTVVVLARASPLEILYSGRRRAVSTRLCSEEIGRPQDGRRVTGTPRRECRRARIVRARLEPLRLGLPPSDAP